jgi:N-terminal domain of anti-restriction factor ArdC
MTSDTIAKALDTLTAEIEKLQTESGLAEFLAWQAKFYQYSAANALLIRAQRPDASQVAGYHRWLELGRFVRRGEKGIVILAPIFRRMADIEDEEDERRPITYRAAYVFDVSQTEPLSGEEAPVPVRPEIACPVLTGEDGRELYSALLKVAHDEGITVSHEPPAEYASMTREANCMGFYVPKIQAIWVRKNAPLQEVKTLAHELAHHFGCHDESNPNNEAMAEGAAYVVLQAFGLDSGARSVPYIVGWDSRKPGAYKSALTGIQQTAKTIIERANSIAAIPADLAA